jgi:galactonate dehydratase
LSAGYAIDMGKRLAKHRPGWYEEPVMPLQLEALTEVKDALPFPIAAGERLYTLEEFERMIALRAADLVQPDLAHCGGFSIARKIAALCQAHGLRLAPHCSIGPVALAAAVHFGWATPQVSIQENFADFDVPWRRDLVSGWNPLGRGKLTLPDRPGLGLELNVEECTKHPYRKNAFPSLWDRKWLEEFTKSGAPS